MGEGSWSNLWAFKAIFRGFKIVSSLRINIWKSKLYEIWINDNFLHVVA